MHVYQCPLCRLPLSPGAGFWHCPQAHRFDCAREGYVNLLPVQFKRSKTPGDNQAMMRARRAFLDAGYYQPMRDAAMAMITGLQTAAKARWLDIGCGEGYYTSALETALAGRGGDIQAYGLDIAKPAVRAAAKRYPRVRFCVASSQRLPFVDHGLDGVLRIYAPCNPAEVYRVLTPDGLLVTVAPGPRHLYQLKERIYSQVMLHPLRDEVLPGFTAAAERRLRFELVLPGTAAGELLLMTPFAWKATPEIITALTALPKFVCETDFILRAWRRDHGLASPAGR
ncbi:23S rRNA (guanine(745)-N(1))-methyltransferase [Martelella alba]|uniref:23S rRNA (Guanine(745)-N(1))-methyltransferase n=1 Tax=Martelella alba TaxID=2590451 RepID=A0ABY2SUS8_9HYPH|nr:23S rRNA (guanine(745)-N(1))-methyltransferase [Martelella alba]TKI08199.1 23S rRNA (guanine(745)-N(1))-methyltransferase [Martelella alba]